MTDDRSTLIKDLPIEVAEAFMAAQKADSPIRALARLAAAHPSWQGRFLTNIAAHLVKKDPMKAIRVLEKARSCLVDDWVGLRYIQSVGMMAFASAMRSGYKVLPSPWWEEDE